MKGFLFSTHEKFRYEFYTGPSKTIPAVEIDCDGTVISLQAIPLTSVSDVCMPYCDANKRCTHILATVET